MTAHSSILWSMLGLVVLLASACDPVANEGGAASQGAAGEGDLGAGRIALVWTLDGASLTADRCGAQKIDYMEVQVQGDTGRIAFTEVRCDLTRYSLSMMPEGRVQVQVRAVGHDSRGEACDRFAGQAITIAGSSFPDAPAPVPLSAVAGCR